MVQIKPLRAILRPSLAWSVRGGVSKADRDTDTDEAEEFVFRHKRNPAFSGVNLRVHVPPRPLPLQSLCLLLFISLLEVLPLFITLLLILLASGKDVYRKGP